MAITFAYRSDDSSFNARYAGGFKTGVVTGTGLSNVVDATAIGGRAVSYTSAATWNALSWAAELNTPNNRTISLLMRYAPSYNGIPAGRRALWGFSNGGGASAPFVLQLYHDLTTGNLVLHSINEAGTTTINFVNMYTWTTNTANTWYDLVFTWDGTTTANSAKLYLDGALVGQTTPAAALSASITNKWRKAFVIGVTPTATASAGKCNELVFFDTVIDPTANVNLESGAGLLNGASRTSYVSDIAGATLTSFDGLNCTDPGIANVNSGTSYFINGVQYTGTLSASPGQKFIHSGDY